MSVEKLKFSYFMYVIMLKYLSINFRYYQNPSGGGGGLNINMESGDELTCSKSKCRLSRGGSSKDDFKSGIVGLLSREI